MSRNILDNLGNIIGTLDLPDGTPESVWTAELALYSNPTPTPQVNMITLSELPTFASNAAALTGGLVLGDLYNNSGTVSVVI